MSHCEHQATKITTIIKPAALVQKSAYLNRKRTALAHGQKIIELRCPYIPKDLSKDPNIPKAIAQKLGNTTQLESPLRTPRSPTWLHITGMFYQRQNARTVGFHRVLGFNRINPMKNLATPFHAARQEGGRRRLRDVFRGRVRLFDVATGMATRFFCRDNAES